MCRAISRVALCGLLLILPRATALAQSPANVHPGMLVDAVSGKPARAEVIAYATRNLGATGDCPQHEELLARSEADAGGAFALRVDAKHQTFVAVYCGEGFVAREQPENDNTIDGSRMVPDPVRLFPSQMRLQAEGVELSAALQEAIGAVLKEVSETLQEQFAASEQAFQAGFRELLPPDQRVVAIVMGRAPRVRRFGPGGDAAGASARTAVAGALNAATMHLRYFAAVSGAGYFPGLKSFRGENQEIIEILRNRALTRAGEAPVGNR